jgi:hypothetical protein
MFKGKGAMQITGKAGFSAAALKRIMDDIYNRPVENMILTEGRISGSRYHCVEPVGGNWKNMELWAIETFGYPGEIWPKDDFDWPEDMRWAMNNRKFWFRNEADRTLFLMKWR